VNGREDERRRGAVRAAVAGVVLLAVAVTVVTGWVDWVSVGAWVRPRAVLLGLWLLGGLLLAGAGYSWWRTRRPRPGHQRMRRSPPLSWWAVAAAALVIAGVAWGATSWLLGKAAAAADPAAAQVEAIKTGLGIGAATAGVMALLLAVRRQWHQEITAADTTADATERRVTELYTKAAEQIGSDKAPVRLAGLYALERLAQDHSGQRQTIVNVLCAYLRMPYTLPGDAPAGDDKVVMAHRERTQEREVRLAAQRVLADHLRPGDDHNNPVETFWADIDLDLTGATLINFNLNHCTTQEVLFNGAKFAGHAGFDHATFTGNARFTQAAFAGNANFSETSFAGHVQFSGASFAGNANFSGASFAGHVQFSGASFAGNARFSGASFAGYAGFGETMFTGYAGFNQASFPGDTDFVEATFADVADFDGATLPSTRYTDHGTPRPWTAFVGAGFARDVPSEVARFVSPQDEDAEHSDET
jgi:hypothetical protein